METQNGKTIEKIIEYSSSHKIKWVLFDYFDTLVSRKVSPETIKMLWSRELQRIIPYIKASEVYEIRCASEQKISIEKNGFTRKEYQYYDLCVEIYKRLLHQYNNTISLIWENEKAFYDWSYQHEMMIELNEQYINEELRLLLGKVKENGCNVAIVSDFYLDKSIFDAFIKKHCLDHMIDRIFISCDYSCRKSDGSLYSLVLKELQIESNECIMIGNNRHSDYYSARKRGITAFWIPASELKCIEKRSEIEKYLADVYRKYRKEAYVGYAYSFYFYIDNLYRQLVIDKVNKAIFLSRDGEFLLELFNLYKKMNDRSEVEGIYAYVSRLSTFVPNLKELESEDFYRLLREYKDISLNSFMLSIGFSSNIIKEIMGNSHFNMNEIIEDYKESEEFRWLKSQSKFVMYYDKIRDEQKRNFDIYMKSLYGNELPNNIAIVDIGWKGTTQDNIYDFYDKRITVKGYYIGLTDIGGAACNNKKVGINFSAVPMLSDGFHIWNYDKTFYEKILYASHPSVHSYKMDADKVSPVFERFDQEETYNIVRPMQEKMIRMFKDINFIFSRSCYNSKDLERDFLKLYLKTICQTRNNNFTLQKQLMKNYFMNFGEFTWRQEQWAQVFVKILKYNKIDVLKKVFQEGLDIKYMFAGRKILDRYHMKLLTKLYIKMVYYHETRKLRRK